MTNIKLDDLETASKLLFGHLKEKGVLQISIEDDFYWEILPEEKYKMSEKPQNIGAGQLTDDCENIQKLISGKNDPIIYDLVWMGSLLKYIGEKIPE